MRVKYGSIVTDGSGKLGGHVASKGRSGSVIRTKVTGTNPRTPAQNSTRALLGSLAGSWKSLTDEQRQSFQESVSKFKSTDIFGDVHNPSGYTLYIKLNYHLLAAGLSINTTCPEPIVQDNNYAKNCQYIENAWESSFIYMSLETYDEYKYILRGCNNVSPGIYNGKSKLAILGYVNNDYGGNINCGYPLYYKLGAQTLGKKLFYSVQRLYPNGQVGAEQFVSCPVETLT
jgi:hypothetical protein